MQYGLIETKRQSREKIDKFGGLNLTEMTEKNEFSYMLDMSSDKYPYITPSRMRSGILAQAGMRAVIAPQYSDKKDITAFTGVAGDKFYYNGTEKSQIIPDGNVTLVDFNGRIIICVYNQITDEKGKKQDVSNMFYYDYTAKGDGTVKPMEQGYTDKIRCSAYSSGDPKDDVVVTNYLQSSAGWSDFNEGDSIFIEGFENTENNTVQLDSRYQDISPKRAVSCIVEKKDGNKLYIQMYNRNGNALVFTKETSDNVKVYKKIPTMNHICIHNNRLWGTNPNGEYIYASKQGDPFNFNTFQGLANDSFYAEIGTAGGFVGIVSYRDNLVAFKRDYIHHIYGDKPSNFTIPKQLEGCGCIDIRSVAQVDSTLYFLGYNGFYAYAGGQPVLISQKLNKKYSKAVAMTDGRKYIAACLGDLLVLDTRYGVWHREKPINAIGTFRWHDKLYIASENMLYEYGTEPPQIWRAESVIIHDDTFDNKGMTELWIRAKIDEGSEIKVLTSEDGGDFLTRTVLKPQGLKVYRIPIRFINGEFYQYRLEGKGDAVIYSIERVISSGGRPYKG